VKLLNGNHFPKAVLMQYQLHVSIPNVSFQQMIASKNGSSIRKLESV